MPLDLGLASNAPRSFVCLHGISLAGAVDFGKSGSAERASRDRGLGRIVGRLGREGATRAPPFFPYGVGMGLAYGTRAEKKAFAASLARAVFAVRTPRIDEVF